MSNRLLIDSMATLRDIGCDVSPCNFGYQWLFDHPSALVYIDKLLVSVATWDAIKKSSFTKDAELSKSLIHLFEMLDGAGIIEIVDVGKVVDKFTADAIEAQVYTDVRMLGERFPGNIKVDEDGEPHNLLTINDGYNYCGVRLMGLYTSVFLAKKLNANLFFERYQMEYLNYKFGLTPMPAEVANIKIDAFCRVFEPYVPNVSVFPHYIYCKNERFKNGKVGKQCKSCAHKDIAGDSYLNELERNVNELMKLRDYDEILEIKTTIDSIDKKNKDGVSTIDIQKEFKEVEIGINRRIKKHLPQIKNWAITGMVISTPITFWGYQSGINTLSALGAGSLALSTVVKGLSDYWENKYKWIGFNARGLRK